MGLSARDRQALDRIAGRLAGSDPWLAGLMATFTRLASSEEMPTRERVAAAPRRLYERLGFQRTALLLWLAIAAALVAAALALSSGGSQSACPTSWPVACAGSASAHSPGYLP